jgi:hypothetical protein
MEVLNDLPDFSVSKQRVVVSYAKSLVQYWMVIEDAWFGAIVTVGTTVTA